MAKKAVEAAGDEPVVFEQSLERLEQIVHQLEEGQLPLSDSLDRYEEGIRHLKQCHRALERAERRIELLAGLDAEGNPVTEPLDDRVESLDEKAASRSRRRSSSPTARANDDMSGSPDTLF